MTRMAVNFPVRGRRTLLIACAISANDCYFFDRKVGFHNYVRELKKYRVEENNDTNNVLQYALYTITKQGQHKGKTILAFRGTASKRTIQQNLDLVDPEQILAHVMPEMFDGLEKVEDGWEKVRDAMDAARKATETLNPDYITGHSLGGVMAEVVSSYTRIPGFSFNCPGPVGLITETPFLNPDREFWQGVEFETHLRRGDPVSQINDDHHINQEPVWYNGFSHRMEELTRDIRKGKRSRKCFGCFGGKKVQPD